MDQKMLEELWQRHYAATAALMSRSGLTMHNSLFAEGEYLYFLSVVRAPLSAVPNYAAPPNKVLLPDGMPPPSSAAPRPCMGYTKGGLVCSLPAGHVGRCR